MIADVILKNGCVYTVGAEIPRAQAIAISGQRILYVGTDNGAEAYRTPGTTVLDLGGKMVVPAFVDTHMHPAESANLYLNQLSLFDVNGVDRVQAYLDAIREYAEDHQEITWIIGAGYRRSVFDELGPRKEWLDQIDAGRPIAIGSSDGHSMWVNSKALELAGVGGNTPQPEEGVIKIDPQTGEPSGLLQEPGAMRLVSRLFPKPTKEQIMGALLWLQGWLNAKGITTAHEAILEVDEPHIYEAYHELARSGLLTVRYRASWGVSPEGDYRGQIARGIELAKRFTTPHFQANSFKFFADHVIEEETGYLLEPYAHRPDWHGIKVWEDEAMKEAFLQVDRAGCQIHVHVIGDAAARYTLDALEHVEEVNGKRDARHSFAHVQMATPEDIKRMGKLGLSAHLSPYWIGIDDYFWDLYLPYLGAERAFRNNYPFQSLMDAGVNVTVASDFSVSEPDIMGAIYSGMRRSLPGAAQDRRHDGDAQSRRLIDLDAELAYGDVGVLPPLAERTSLEGMLAACTINGAYANFLDGEIGSIEVGKLADLVVLARNLFEIDTEAIPSTQVVMTFFEGRLIYEAEYR